MSAGREVSLSISSKIGNADATRITVRGHDLVDELIGQVSQTQMALLAITGELPDEPTTRVVDAVLVSLLDHGLTPSALATRLTYWSAPEAIQGAVVAGLLGAGSVLLGSMERCGRLLTEIDAAIAAGEEEAHAVDRLLAELLGAGERVPGLGHSLHQGGDPRAGKLLEVAEREGKAGRHVRRLRIVEQRAEALVGKRLPLNATGAAAALLLECNIPWQLHRGFALMSRTAGLVAHVGEEIAEPITPEIRRALRDASRPDEV
jgi:citrate synthase